MTRRIALLMQPSRNDHLNKAKRNRDFADKLPKNDPTFTGWALIALFYSALHYVNGYLARYNVRYGSHKALEVELAKNDVLSGMYNDYMDLFDYGHNARYTMRNYSIEDFRKARESFDRIEKHILTLCR